MVASDLAERILMAPKSLIMPTAEFPTGPAARPGRRYPTSPRRVSQSASQSVSGRATITGTAYAYQCQWRLEGWTP